MAVVVHNSTQFGKQLSAGLNGAGLILLAAGLAVAYWFVYEPLLEAKTTCDAQIAKLDHLLKDADQIRQTHTELKASLGEISQRARALRQRIPDSPREGEFLKQFLEAAEAARLDVVDYRRGPLTEHESCSQLEVHVSCAGSYGSLCEFLDRLEKLPRIATVRKVHVLAAPLADNYPVDLDLLLYFEGQTDQKEEKKSDV